MSEIKLACPHCSQHIACDDSCGGMKIECPSCGSAMKVPGTPFSLSSCISPAWQPVAATATIPSPQRANTPVLSVLTHWPMFWLVLLAPAILSLLALGIFKSETVWLQIMLVGSSVAGIICGIMLARRWGKESVSTQILIFIFGAPVLALLSLGFCAVGCTVVVIAQIGKH